MSAATQQAADVASREIIASRLLKARLDVVWNAWTEPEQIARWWGPAGFTTTIAEMDVRPGGAWRFVMRGPDGTEYPNEIIYVEVVPHERLVYDHVVQPHFRSTVTFVGEAGNTRVTVSSQFESAAARDAVVREHGALEGLQQNLAKLAAQLGAEAEQSTTAVPDTPHLQIRRSFAAPRELVWKAFTDPEHLARWWGPQGVSNPVCNLAAVEDGPIHIVMRAGEELGPLRGNEWPMVGTIREIVPPSRLVFTSSAIDEGKAILENLVTVSFEEHDGRTDMLLQVVVTMVTPAAKGPLSGMEQGWTQSIDKLEAYIARQAA